MSILWTESEIEQLRELAGKIDTRAIAKQTGRSKPSVATKMAKLGLKGKPSGWQYPWTAEQIEALKSGIDRNIGAHAIARETGKSKPAIYKRARMLGLDMTSQRHWTDANIECLRANGPSMTANELMPLLKRSDKTIRWKAQDIGISLKKVFRSAKPKPEPKMRFWTEAEISTLKELVDRMRLPELSSKIGRTERSIERKAQTLGLRITGKSGMRYAPRTPSNGKQRPHRRTEPRAKPAPPKRELVTVSRLAWCESCRAPVVNTIAGWAGHRERVGCGQKNSIHLLAAYRREERIA